MPDITGKKNLNDIAGVSFEAHQKNNNGTEQKVFLLFTRPKFSDLVFDVRYTNEIRIRPRIEWIFAKAQFLVP